MASDEGSYPGEDEIAIQAYLNTFANIIFEEVESTSMEVMEVIGNNKVDVGSVTYFIGDDGNYYYQPADDTQHFIPLDNVENTEEMGQNALVLLDEQNKLQTVVLVPPEIGIEEVNYIPVVQEYTQTLDDIDKIIEQQQKGNDEYTLNEEGIEVECESSAVDVEEPELKSEKGNNDEILANNAKNKSNKITCNFCKFTTHKEYLLVRHMQSHSEERPYKCSVCERRYKRLSTLQEHLNNHNGVKPFICKYCPSSFTTSKVLLRHVRYIHTLEKPYKCKVCDYASVEMWKLRRHVRCHTGERPYHCPHCTYASIDTYNLKRHLRSHTVEKPYKCDKCNICFAQPKSLKSHTLKHHGSMKPVCSCDQCPATYRRKIDLRNHVNKKHSAEKPLNESIKQKEMLHRHENLFHNPDYVPRLTKEKTHTCPECKRNFAHKGNLTQHLAVHGQKLSQQEPPHEHGEQILFDVNNEDRGEEAGDLNLNKDGDSERDPEEVVTANETDDLQYMILEVIQLANEQQHNVVAPEYGENEVHVLPFNQII